METHPSMNLPTAWTPLGLKAMENHVFFKANPSYERSPSFKDRSDVGSCTWG